MNAITRFRGEHFFLSNFFPTTIKYEGFTYPSAEHAYQAQKSDSYEWKIFCTDERNSAGLVKQLSRNQKYREDWHEVNEGIMESIQRIKYSDNYMRMRLLETGDRELIEGNYHNDKYYGMCLKSNPMVGDNRMGKILMRIREKCKLESL